MRLTATIRVEIVADTPEASDFLLKTVTRNVGSGHLMAYLKGADGSQRAARIERATITRVRPTRKTKSRKR